MQLLHDDSFISLLKSAILSEVRGLKVVHESNSSKGVNVNQYSLKRCLLEWEWLHEPALEVSKLRNAVNLFVLHKNKDYELLYKVLRQALIHGSEYIILRKSRAAVKFCNMVRSVRSEFHSACAFSKYRKHDDKLFCNYYFSHKIQNLLINHLSKRFPDKEVIVNNFNKPRHVYPRSVKLGAFFKSR